MPALPDLAPLDMSILSGDDIILRGTLRYPGAATSARMPLAILAHQYPATRACFAPLVEDLLSLGVATLAFDERGHGKSIWRATGGDAVVIDAPNGFDLAAFGTAFVSSIGKVGFGKIDDDILRVAGWGISQNLIDPSRIILVGGSVGGAGSVLAAPRVPGLKALITFGAAGVPAFGNDAAERARTGVAGLGCRCLFVSSEGDPFEGAKNANEWAAAGRDARAIIVPGDEHAMAIYYDARDEVLGFLRNVLQ